MYEPIKVHISQDKARAELAERWNNAELKKEVEKELGEKFMPQFSDYPRGVSFRQLCTPDSGFTFFCQCAEYVGSSPLVLEFHDDMFTHLSEDKKGLGRLRIILEDGSKATVDVMNFHESEKNKLGKCVLKNGENLVDFHHKLIDISGYKVDIIDNSKWFKSIGRAADYYYTFFLHFVAHGILFENIEAYTEEDGGAPFIDNITTPALQKIKEKYGLFPLVVRMYPQDQTTEEDFYWWSYPCKVNDYIVNYAKENGFAFKSIKL